MTKGKPASLGAIVMLGGGLLVYWALSQWGLFGLGDSSSTSANGSGNGFTQPSSFGGGSSSRGGGGSSTF